MERERERKRMVKGLEVWESERNMRVDNGIRMYKKVKEREKRWKRKER